MISLLSLPPELLSEIFLCYNFSSYTSSSQILLLGSISRYFRTIAWNVPQLWSRISLTLSEDPLLRDKQVAGLVSWLGRSAECPLHMRLECATRDTSPNVSNEHWASGPLISAVDAVLVHCTRWEEIYLMLPYQCYTHIFQRKGGKARSMPMLRQFTLVGCKNWTTTSNSNSSAISAVSSSLETITMALAPALQKVDLINLPPSCIQELPWTQLIQFRGYELCPPDALDALHRATHLQSCTLTTTCGAAASHSVVNTLPPPTTLGLTHARLRELRLEGNTTVLKYLTLPALERLQITSPGAFSAQQCVRLLRRSLSGGGSGTRLTELDIAVNFISVTDLVECLEAAPGLRALRVLNRNDKIHSVFGDELVGRLTRAGKDKCKPSSLSSSLLVPHLSSLEVVGCCCQFGIEKLGAMLWSRWNHGHNRDDEREWSPLERFLLETNSGSPLIGERIMQLPEIMKLVQLGMVVEVVCAQTQTQPQLHCIY